MEDQEQVVTDQTTSDGQTAVAEPESQAPAAPDDFNAAFDAASTPPAPAAKPKRSKADTSSSTAATAPAADAQPGGDTAATETTGAEPTAQEMAEASGKAALAATGTATDPAPNTSSPSPKTETAKAPEAAKASGGELTFADLKLPEKVIFNGKEFDTASVIEDYGEDAGALSMAIAQAALAQAVDAGVVVPMKQFQETIQAIRDDLAWEQHMNAISSAARLDARSVLADKTFQGWLEKQSEGIKLLAQRGTAQECGQVLRAFYEQATGGKQRAQGEDKRREEETKRRKELHANTLRDTASGRFAGSGGGAGDFGSAFEEFARVSGL